MENLAILVGNDDYANLNPLNCCIADVGAMADLLRSTDKYDKLITIENNNADDLKAHIRTFLENNKEIKELFFYFTGHGTVIDGDFFICAVNFDKRKPNETGISTTELHALLKSVDASLVVKVIDACNSGVNLIKNDGASFFQHKSNFANLIQIASCLDSQNSLSGNPLSKFTGSFIASALRKKVGEVFYTDIINTLRDDYIDDNFQTPFFVSQCTGRELFVDDASRFNRLRQSSGKDENVSLDDDASSHEALPIPLTLLERLRAADSKVASPELIISFTSCFLDKITALVSQNDYVDFFTAEITTFQRFDDKLSEDFITTVLAKEKRPDEFVTAIKERRLKQSSPIISSAIMQGLLGNDAFTEVSELKLNYPMERAQLRISLIPKFANLQRLTLVVTCAPSLDNCYVFEYITSHLLTSFGKFNGEGNEISKRWWRKKWRDEIDDVIEQIEKMLTGTVRSNLEAAELRLSGD